MSSFLSDLPNILGGASRRGVAVCSVAPNLPLTSPCHSERSPSHKVSWEMEGEREEEMERERDEREEEWEQRAYELERTQRTGKETTV